MKKYGSLIICLFSLFIYAQNKRYTKIFWKEDRELRWKDFKAVSDKKNSNIAALSYCGIQYTSCKENTGKYTYQVTSFFIPDLSWAEVKTDDVLKHEQLHFDIAELFTRKLRGIFLETEVLPKDSQKKIYKPLFDEYVKMQNLYDDETNHGINKERNTYWAEKIKAELENMEDYKKDICY